MKTTKTFENASLVSVVDGVITIKAETGRNHTFKRSSLISIVNGTITIETNEDYPILKPGMIVENNHGTRFLTMVGSTGKLIGVSTDVWDSDIQKSFTTDDYYIVKVYEAKISGPLSLMLKRTGLKLIWEI